MLNEKAQRAQDIVREIERLEAELNELCEPAEEEIEITAKPRKKWTRRTKEKMEEDIKTGIKHTCCGSKGLRHKKTCGNRGKLSDDENDVSIQAKCVTCDHVFKTDKPLYESECPKCHSQALVQDQI